MQRRCEWGSALLADKSPATGKGEIFKRSVDLSPGENAIVKAGFRSQRLNIVFLIIDNYNIM